MRLLYERTAACAHRCYLTARTFFFFCFFSLSGLCYKIKYSYFTVGSFDHIRPLVRWSIFMIGNIFNGVCKIKQRWWRRCLYWFRSLERGNTLYPVCFSLYLCGKMNWEAKKRRYVGLWRWSDLLSRDPCSLLYRMRGSVTRKVSTNLSILYL